MKLYTTPGACSMADHIALEWIGQPYTAQIVSREQRGSPEFRKLNPAGAVPVFEDGDWLLTQNSAILNYLADKFPQSGLGGDGTPRSRAEVNRWLGFLNADVHPAFHPLFGKMDYLGEETAEAVKQAARRKLRGYFERLDAQLEEREWLTGARSIADPYLFVMLRWAKANNVDLAGLHNLAAFEKRMRADEGVQKVLREEGVDQAA